MVLGSDIILCTVFLSNLSHQRDGTVPTRIVPYRTETLLFKNTITFKREVFLTHRDMQRYIEKYAVTPIVTLICNGKYGCYTYGYRYYRYRTLKNIELRATLQASLQFWSRITRTRGVRFRFPS